MIKKILLLAVASFFTGAAFSQWHPAAQALVHVRDSQYYFSTIRYINRYDTVFCKYRLAGSDSVYRGYKYVFIESGFYVDREGTLGVFFDDKKRRIGNVESYCFR